MKVLLIGATGKLGYEISKELIRLGDNLTICGRNEEKIKYLINELNSNIDYFVSDLMDVNSCILLALHIINNRYDTVIFNQGIFSNDYLLNDDGIESHFMVNAFSQYLVLKCALPKINKLNVLTVSSISCYKRNVNIDLNSKNLKKWNYVYGKNKLLQIKLMKELEKEFSHINFIYAHPGICYSGLSSGLHSNFVNFFVKNFMMKPCDAIKPILMALIANEKDCWCCPSGLFQLVGKPKCKKIKKKCLYLEEDIKLKINDIVKELNEKYGF